MSRPSNVTAEMAAALAGEKSGTGHTHTAEEMIGVKGASLTATGAWHGIGVVEAPGTHSIHVTCAPPEGRSMSDFRMLSVRVVAAGSSDYNQFAEVLIDIPSLFDPAVSDTALVGSVLGNISSSALNDVGVKKLRKNEILAASDKGITVACSMRGNGYSVTLAASTYELYI